MTSPSNPRPRAAIYATAHHLLHKLFEESECGEAFCEKFGEHLFRGIEWAKAGADTQTPPLPWSPMDFKRRDYLGEEERLLLDSLAGIWDEGIDTACEYMDKLAATIEERKARKAKGKK